VSDSLRKQLLDALIANWPLIAIGTPGVWAAYRTLKIIASQAESMTQQTVVLRKSVDATIASERAWVMVDLEKQPGDLFISDLTSGDGSHSTGAFVRCVCSNQGKTPAKIKEKRICLFVTTIVKPLPNEPNLDIKTIDSGPHYLPAGESSTHDWAIVGEGQQSIGCKTVIYGVVKYEHLFSNHEVHTTFAYQIGVGGNLERLVENPKYNEST
jgi:hypothetical protein